MALDLKSFDPWTRATIKINITNRLTGGIPTNPALIEGWLKGMMKEASDKERADIAAKTANELPTLTEELADKMWTTFKRDEKGLYYESRCLKASFKEVANILRDKLTQYEAKNSTPDAAEDGDEEAADSAKPAKGKAKGAKVTKSRFTNLRAKAAERLFVEGDKLYLMRDEKTHITKVDRTDEKAIHVMTAQGPRTALKRVDIVEPPAFFIAKVRWLDDKLIDEDLLNVFLDYMSFNGIGAERSQGSGLISHELTIDNPPMMVKRTAKK